MTIEDTKFIVELRDFDEVNKYLALGWLLTGQYVIDVGEYGRLDQRTRYILAWQKQDIEPEHPEDSSYLRDKREAEHFKAMVNRNKII